MDIALKIHIEASEAGSPIWWAESDDLPGLTASADTLAELRVALAEVLEEFGKELAVDAGHAGETIQIVSELLVAGDMPAPVQPSALFTRDGITEERRPATVQVLIPA